MSVTLLIALLIVRFRLTCSIRFHTVLQGISAAFKGEAVSYLTENEHWTVCELEFHYVCDFCIQFYRHRVRTVAPLSVLLLVLLHAAIFAVPIVLARGAQYRGFGWV